jgi:hypothetical protein
MDILNSSQAPLNALRTQESQDSVAPRQAVRLDVASWIALVVFVAYIGVGVLA